MNIITLNEERLLEGVWDTMKEKFGNDKVAKFRQLKDGNQLPSGGDFEQKKNPQYWNNKTVEEFNEYLNGVIEGNFYNDRQKEDLTSKLRVKLARTINVSAANELARAFWEHRNEIPDQEQRNIKYWIQNQNVGYGDLAAVLQPIQARKSNAAGRYDKVYESDFMIIYRVYDWIAARNLSRGTSWCITGRYSSENGDGSGFFTSYLPENGKEEDSQYHYYYIVHDLTHRITYRGNRIRSHTENTPQQYCMQIDDHGQISEVWEPGDTRTKRIPWIPAEHQVQPIPGVTIPYGDVAGWPEPRRVDLAGRADNLTNFTSQFVIEDGVLVGCNTPSGTVYIPDTVTKIGKKAFENSAITQVIIPNSVTKIGQNAFHSCTSLKSIEIPGSVTAILSDAFHGCSSLQSVVIANGVKKISKNAFTGCLSLESITIPDTVTEIGNEIFYSCRSLQNITIPDSITVIPTSTFYNCIALKSVTISNNATEIGDYAFQNCLALQRVVIPNGVTRIGIGAFRTCRALESITIPNSVTEIGHGAFYSCSSLKSVEIPNSVTEIDYHIFDSCSSLQSVKLSNNITRIPASMFFGCSSLKSVIIPNNVTEIAEYAFYNCYSLESVTIPSSVASLGNSIFGNHHEDLVVNTDNRIVINYCARNNINYQRITPQSGEESQQIDDTTSQFTIENGVLINCNIQSGVVHIPNTVTKIGERAFESSEITKVVIPNSVTEIDDEAFYNCRSLESVVIPDSVTEFGEKVFTYCRSLKSITIPDNVTQISPNMFHGCHSLESIVIPDSVTEIRYGAFFNCKSLKNIVIPNSVTDIGSSTF